MSDVIDSLPTAAGISQAQSVGSARQYPIRGSDRPHELIHRRPGVILGNISRYGLIMYMNHINKPDHHLSSA